MNFDDAIAAHIKWKIRLSQYVDGTSTEKMLSSVACKDDLCDLGKWIYGDATKYESLPHYQDVVKKHAHFHLCAAEVIKKVEASDRAAAKSALGGAYAIASKETVTAIIELKKKVAGRTSVLMPAI